MKNRFRLYALLIVPSLMGVAGCGGGNPAPPPPALIRLAISPKGATLSPSASVQFTAHMGTTTPPVTWSVLGTSCSGAACGTVSASGLYTSPASISASVLVGVTATLQSDPSKTASASVTVRASTGGLVLSPQSANVVSGGLQSFSAGGCSLVNFDIGCGGFKLSGTNCSGASCGTLIYSASRSTIYQAPLVLPVPPQVMITVTDLIKGKATGSISLHAPDNTLLSGPYAFLVSGSDTSGPVVTAGTFSGDGSGNVTGGTLDVLRPGGVTNLSITGGTYSIGADLLGSLSLQTAQGVRGFRIALNPAGTARLIESDTSGIQASGILKKQQAGTFSNASMSGNFAFGLSGNASDRTRSGLVGAFNANGSGGLGTGLMDANVNGSSSASVPWNGSYGVSTTGRVRIQLNASVTATNGHLSLVGYLVSSQELVLIGSDTAPIPHLLGGWARTQTGTPFAAPISFMIATSGVSGTGTSALAANLFAPTAPNPAQAFVTQNLGGISQIAVPANWTYTLATQSRGRINLQSSPPRSFVFYLSGSESGFILENSGSEVLSGEMFAGSNLYLPGNYRLGTEPSNLAQSSFSGSIDAADCSQIVGSVDTSTGGSSATGQHFAATCSSDPNNQVFILSITQPSNLAWVLHGASMTESVAVPVTPGDSSPSLIFVER